MTITYETFRHLFQDALETDDKDLYIAEQGSSSLLIDPEDESEPDWEGIISLLSDVWELAHMTVADLCKAAGFTTADLSRRFLIPLRTVQSWISRERECPAYTRLMMAELLGLCRVSRS